MQSYNTLQEVIKLALKVEAINKHRSSTISRSMAKEEFSKDPTSRIPSDTKTTLKPQLKSEVHKP